LHIFQQNYATLLEGFPTQSFHCLTDYFNIILPLFYSFPKQNPATVFEIYTTQSCCLFYITLHQLLPMDCRVRFVIIEEICRLVPPHQGSNNMKKI
jgi:hypothetical protein